MTVLIVYESAWGNTKAVAEAVSAGLAEASDVEVLGVDAAPALAGLQVELLVVGAPTHAFGLSRPETREDAVRRGGHPGATGLREWIGAAGGDLRLSVAAFDTHVRHPNLPGTASKKMAKALRGLGCTLVAKPESFYVDGYEGPVVPGELERARAWGARLAGLLPEVSRAY